MMIRNLIFKKEVIRPGSLVPRIFFLVVTTNLQENKKDA